MKKALIIVALLLAACKPDAQTADAPAADRIAEMERMAQECAAQGGTTTIGGHGQPVCEVKTKDAGKSCKSSADCEGMCLAQGGGTCAPSNPYFGCFETLENGVKATLCVD